MNDLDAFSFLFFLSMTSFLNNLVLQRTQNASALGIDTIHP